MGNEAWLKTGKRLQFPEIVEEGKVTISLYELESGNWTVADQGGWLPGSFQTREEALAYARAENGLA